MIRHGEWRKSWRKPAFPREPLPWPRNGLWAGNDAVESGVHQRAGFACPWFRGPLMDISGITEESTVFCQVNP